MTKLFEHTVNETLYKTLWQNSEDKWHKRVVYILIPWVLLSILYCILYFKNALLIDGAYGFLNDFTNWFVLSYVFVFIYYISGYYTTYSKESIKLYVNKVQTANREKCETTLHKINSLIPYVHIISAILSLLGMWFIYVSNMNGASNWYAKLTSYQLLYYCFLIALTWYMSANVLIHTLLTAIAFYKIFDYDLQPSIKNADGACGFNAFFDFCAKNLGMALNFLLCGIFIIISDFRAIHYGVDNAFHKYPILCVVIILLLVFYVAMMLLPFFKAKKIVTDLVDEELTKYKYPNTEIDNLMRIRKSMYSFKNILTPILTTAIPIVLKIVDIFFK